MNQGYLPEYLKSNSEPPEMISNPEFRERMQGLLDLILRYIEFKDHENDPDNYLNELL